MREYEIEDYIRICEIGEWYQVRTTYGVYEVWIGEPKSTIAGGFFYDLDDDHGKKTSEYMSFAIKCAAKGEDMHFRRQGMFFRVIADAVEIYDT